MKDIIYLTGATGFVGQMIVKRCETNDSVQTVYCPVREKKGVGGIARFEELFGDRSKAVYIDPSDDLPDNVTRVILAAYSVRFDVALESILRESVEPMLNILDQCAKSKNVKGIAVVSTAYSQPPLPYKRHASNYIPFIFRAHMTASQLHQDLVDGKTTGKELVETYGDEISNHYKVNNYALSKHIMENLIHERYPQLPICITRPSIVVPSRDGTHGRGIKTGFPLFLEICRLPVLFFMRNEGKLNFIRVEDAAEDTIKASQEWADMAKETDIGTHHPIRMTTSDFELSSMDLQEIGYPYVKIPRFEVRNNYLRLILRGMELTLLYLVAGKKVASLISKVYRDFDPIMSNTWDYAPTHLALPGEPLDFARQYYTNRDGGKTIKLKISKSALALRFLAALCLVVAVTRMPQAVKTLRPASLRLPHPETLQRTKMWFSAFFLGTSAPIHPSTKPQDLQVEVVFAGFGRSGSHSFQAALERLGYNTCHGEDILLGSLSSHADLAGAIMRQDFDAMLGYTEALGYNATMELHSSFWRLIRARRPNAKYIFVVREFNSWWKSIVRLFESYKPLFRFPMRALPLFGKIGSLKILAAAHELNVTRQDARNFFLNPSSEQHRAARQWAYDLYVQDALRLSAESPQNTLVFRLDQQGGFSYPVLCGFLGVKVCPQEDFPRVCDRAEISRMGYVSRGVEGALYVLAALLTFVVWKVWHKGAPKQGKEKKDFSKCIAAVANECQVMPVSGGHDRSDEDSYSSCHKNPTVTSDDESDDSVSDDNLGHDESALWVLLGIVALTVYPSEWAARIAVASALWEMTVAQYVLSEDCNKEHWPTPGEGQSPWRSSFPDEGRVMAKVLIPILLLATAGPRETSKPIDDSNFSVLSAVTLLLDNEQMGSHHFGVLSVVVVVLTAVLPPPIWKDFAPFTIQGVMFLAIAWSLRRSIYFLTAFQKVFTEGEWTIVSYFTAISLVKGIVWRDIDEEDMHRFVALSIVIGCILACAVTSYMRGVPPFFRLLFMIGITTAITKMLMHRIGQQGEDGWLLRFLSEVEEPPHWARNGSILYPILPLWPRYCWTIYMIAVAVIGLSLLAIKTRPGPVGIAPPVTSNLFDRNAIVMERKYIHVFILVLAPPLGTMAPQLASLFSAMLLCAFLCVEVVRPDIPQVDRMYRHFLDPVKEHGGGGRFFSTDNTNKADNGHSAIMFSHIALFIGSVAPWWIVESSKVSQETGWLPFLGALCIGVGDTMGAVVGVLYGQQRWWWGRNGRTIEGSLAMLLSTILAGYMLAGTHADSYDCFATLIVLVYATVLEAYTLQMDNLVVALAGATLLLLLQQLKAAHFQAH